MVEETAELDKLITQLWAVSGDDGNFFELPQFKALVEYCRDRYESGRDDSWLSFAISNALRSLGPPPRLPRTKQRLALPAEEASRRLHNAFVATSATRVHLCPLDQAADELPAVKFGAAAIGRLTASELMARADSDRLERVFSTVRIDWDALAQFHWMIVEDTVPITTAVGERTAPHLYLPLSRDLGAYVPHKGQFPTAVEQALFGLLLAPWESWADSIEVEWRPFRVPWVLTLSGDLFAQLPAAPPNPASLTWEPHFYQLANGEMDEVEEPARLFRLSDDASRLPTILDEMWSKLQIASGADLLAGPVAHFMVRAFLSEDIDEFLAHLTTIEAGLGLKSDYSKRRATKIMSARVTALLGDAEAGAEYGRLFELRSAYIHGRAMTVIGSADQTSARRLARCVVSSLVTAAAATPSLQRDQYLLSLGG